MVKISSLKESALSLLKGKAGFAFEGIKVSLLRDNSHLPDYKIRWGLKCIKVRCLSCRKLELRNLSWCASRYGCLCTKSGKIAKALGVTRARFSKLYGLKERGLAITSRFEKQNSKVDVKCLICGHRWNTFAGNLRSHGCGPCARKKAGDAREAKYGSRSTTASPESKSKKRLTMIGRYGVEHALQNRQLFDKSRLSMGSLKTVLLGKRTVEVQGYEPQALKWLTSTYGLRPSQIRCGRGDKKVPRIKYSFEGKKCVYHPDIFIPSLNLIVEVKGIYTYQADKARNEAKRAATRAAGFRFRYLVMDREGNRICKAQLQSLSAVKNTKRLKSRASAL